MVDELFQHLRLLQQARRQRNRFALAGLAACIGSWLLMGVGLLIA